MYIGNLVQMRTTTVSYKNHKVIRKDKADWIVAEHNHEPIIEQELWDNSHEVDASVSTGKSTKYYTCGGENNPLPQAFFVNVLCLCLS